MKSRENLIHCFELLSDCGVVQNSELDRTIYV